MLLLFSIRVAWERAGKELFIQFTVRGFRESVCVPFPFWF